MILTQDGDKYIEKHFALKHLFQLADDMPNMVTAAERDPGQLNFKSQHLSISKSAFLNIGAETLLYYCN